MAGFYPIPPVLTPKLLLQLPKEDHFKGVSDWKGGNGHVPSVFFEGITTTKDGLLYVVDIPFGRILRCDPSVENPKLEECVQWDGEPNGMAVRDDGKMIVADYKKGLLLFNPVTNAIEPFLAR